MPLLLASPVIAAGGELPAQCTRDRPDISPPLTWCGVPDGTKSLVLVLEDPDAPSGIFRHRAVFDIPRGSHGLGAGYSINPTVAGLHEARNDFGKPAYGSPCPPKGHHYHFRMLAISRANLDLRPTHPPRTWCGQRSPTLFNAPNWSARINVN